jgi:opacity protein-like surface antigen
MGIRAALILAGAAAVGTASAGLAADLPPPPIIQAPPEPIEVGGWYLRGDVGVGSYEEADLRSTFSGTGVVDSRFDQQSLGDAAFAGGGIGYQFNPWLRFDATGEYRTSQTVRAIQSYSCNNAAYVGCFAGGSYSDGGDGRGYDGYQGTVQSTVALVNAYADLGTWYGFTPFIGAGVGASFNRTYGFTDTGLGGSISTVTFAPIGLGGFGYAKGKTSVDLAWAAMVGVSYAVTPNVSLEVGYRHLDMGTARTAGIQCYGGCGDAGHESFKVHLASDDVRLGVRWLFNDVAPIQPIAYPPPPIVRKY